jgi:hypothetical protein
MNLLIPRNGLEEHSVGEKDMVYSRTPILKLIPWLNIVLNQEAHHQKKTIKQEYHELLKDFEIAFEEKYLFEFVEEAPTEPTVILIIKYYKQ